MVGRVRMRCQAWSIPGIKNNIVKQTLRKKFRSHPVFNRTENGGRKTARNNRITSPNQFWIKYRSVFDLNYQSVVSFFHVWNISPAAFLEEVQNRLKLKLLKEKKGWTSKRRTKKIFEISKKKKVLRSLESNRTI